VKVREQASGRLPLSLSADRDAGALIAAAAGCSPTVQRRAVVSGTNGRKLMALPDQPCQARLPPLGPAREDRVTPGAETKAGLSLEPTNELRPRSDALFARYHTAASTIGITSAPRRAATTAGCDMLPPAASVTRRGTRAT
jgi:hypothetical protein